MEDITKDATETVNVAPASQESITVLVEGKEFSAVRWFDPRVQKEMYEVEVEGKLYLARQTGQAESNGMLMPVVELL